MSDCIAGIHFCPTKQRENQRARGAEDAPQHDFRGNLKKGK